MTEKKTPGTLRKRLPAALTAYAVIGVAAAVTLDSHYRLVVLLLLGALAFKTWLGVKKEEQQDHSD